MNNFATGLFEKSETTAPAPVSERESLVNKIFEEVTNSNCFNPYGSSDNQPGRLSNGTPLELPNVTVDFGSDARGVLDSVKGIATEFVPKEATFKLPMNGDQIWDKTVQGGSIVNQGDRSLWYGANVVMPALRYFGAEVPPIENASASADGTAYIVFGKSTDVKLDKPIAGGLASINGLHIDKGVTVKADVSDNQVKLSNISGMSVDMSVMGYPVHSNVKEITVKHAADGTSYIDVQLSNPLPDSVRKLAHLPEDIHVHAKVGADGVAHVDVAATANDVKESVKNGPAGKVLNRIRKWTNRI